MDSPTYTCIYAVWIALHTCIYAVWMALHTSINSVWIALHTCIYAVWMALPQGTPLRHLRRKPNIKKIRGGKID